MKTTKQILVLAVMLLTSMTVSAQRAKMTFTGTIGNFPTGGSSAVTLTIDPYGTYEFKVAGSKTVSAFTIKGKHQPNYTYDLPAANGQKGIKATGTTWALQVAEWTAFDNNGMKGNTAKEKNSGSAKFSPAQGNIKGAVMGRTEDQYIKLNISLKAVNKNGQQVTVPLECTLKK